MIIKTVLSTSMLHSTVSSLQNRNVGLKQNRNFAADCTGLCLAEYFYLSMAKNCNWQLLQSAVFTFNTYTSISDGYHPSA